MRQRQWHWFAWIAAFTIGVFVFKLAFEHSLSAHDPLAEDVQAVIERHQISYIGDITSQVFHRKDCPIASQIPNRFQVMFFYRRAALEMKFNPCPYCRP
ncbi:MAG: hypothetical protein NZ805_01225 [Armatimonadetes bacterium]|nr:hypothetical protein [Armatimonadota bacterium]MDW8027466.1 hypothetical protein [Armatimonadota bacterium]